VVACSLISVKKCFARFSQSRIYEQHQEWNKVLGYLDRRRKVLDEIYERGNIFLQLADRRGSAT
jgi:hypothetical protein